MIKWLLFLLAIIPASAATIPVNSSMSVATIQAAINSGNAGVDTVQFAAGTYNITAGITLKCGLTYSGPVATPATAVLSASFTRESTNIFTLNTGSSHVNPCTQPTTIEYFDFLNAGGIHVLTSFTNLTITHNQFTNLPCCNNSGTDNGIYFDGTGVSTNTTAILTNAAVTWNVFGSDMNSCETPSTGNMENTGVDNAGNCSGMRIVSTVNGLVFENNSFVHIGEGVPIGCASPPGGHNACEPTASSGTPPGNGFLTQNLTARYNDFAGVHRIAWEEQPQQTLGVDFEYNSYHDPYIPFFGNFDLSFACCENGVSSPYLVVNNNALIQNVATPACPSYIGPGIEAHGTQASYSNNLVQGLNGARLAKPACTVGPYPIPGIEWGFGANPRNYNNNYVCGPYFNGQYLVAENPTYATPSSLVGNVTATSCHATTSMAPTISPTPTGTYSAPISVTLTDPGYSSGAQPLGNTTIYYTTDGSTPTTNSAVCNIVPATSCTITVAQGSTVNAIGMWGSGANTKTYPAGYGFVPSALVGAHYPSSGGGSPTLTGVSISLQAGGSTVGVGNSAQACANMSYTGSISTQVCGPGADVYGTTPNTWLSTVPADATISSAGLVTGLVAGTTSVSVKAGSFTATALPITVTAAPAGIILGNNQVTSAFAGFTSANYVNNVYAVTGTAAGGYNASTCTFNLPVSYPSGSLVDCVVNLAPTATTRSATDLCWATYTATGTSSDTGFHSLPISGCGTLPPSTGYWVETVTNAAGSPGYSFWTCGSSATPSCSGGVPPSNNGTYHYFYQSSTYGVHSGLTTALNAGNNVQPSQYLTLSTPLPTLIGAVLLTPGATTILSVGGSAQFFANCSYSDGTSPRCWPTPDQYGDTVTHFTSSDPTKMTVGDIGSAHPGLAVGVAVVGTVNVQATVTGGLAANPWPMQISNTPLPYPPSSPRGLSAK